MNLSTFSVTHLLRLPGRGSVRGPALLPVLLLRQFLHLFLLVLLRTFMPLRVFGRRFFSVLHLPERLPFLQTFGRLWVLFQRLYRHLHPRSLLTDALLSGG